MKKTLMRGLFAAMALCLPVAAAQGADLKDPKQIVQKSEDYMLSLNSYSYTVNAEGWDTNPGESAKRVSSTADSAGKQFGNVAVVTKEANNAKKDAGKTDTSKWVYKKYNVENRFMKPYLIRSFVVMSEYTPEIIWGSVLTYRPDKNPKVFWIKPKISPTPIKRDITTESGKLPAVNLYLEYAILDGLGKSLKPALKGSKKIAGADNYMVEWVIPKGKLKAPAVDFKKWGTPKEGQKDFTDEVGKYFTDKNIARTVYYFDKKSFLPLMREDYQTNGKLLRRLLWTKISVNNLTVKDFDNK